MAVENSTGLAVLLHSDKKPGCGSEIMEYFQRNPETGVTRPDQIAVVGDRLTTDVMMANMMGSYAVWVKDGVVPPEETSVVRKASPSRTAPRHLTSFGEVCAFRAEVCGVSATSRLRSPRPVRPVKPV